MIFKRHGHADPNLTHAAMLVKMMGLNSKGEKVDSGSDIPLFGAAADGDADRTRFRASVHIFIYICIELHIKYQVALAV